MRHVGPLPLCEARPTVGVYKKAPGREALGLCGQAHLWHEGRGLPSSVMTVFAAVAFLALETVDDHGREEDNHQYHRDIEAIQHCRPPSPIRGAPMNVQTDAGGYINQSAAKSSEGLTGLNLYTSTTSVEK